MMLTPLAVSRRAFLISIALVLVVIGSGGCAGPGPKVFPPQPLRVEQVPAGGELAWYDTSGDGRADYAEQTDATGRISRLRYAKPGCAEEDVDLAAIPVAEKRDLVIILDSVPYPLVRDAWQQGRFRFFYPPIRTIPPFPVMTDPSLIDFFHMSPGIAIEADYCEGRRETSPYTLYLEAKMATWHEKVDYWLPHTDHGYAYLNQMPWFDHELRAIQNGFERSDQKTYVGYCVGTSALGALQGWDGHVRGLVQVDRLCHELIYRTHGRIRITLFSDHGHNNVEASRRVPIADLMRSFGYHVGDKLNSPCDLILPEFAMVSCSAMYTKAPARPAHDAITIDGMELAAYPDETDHIIVLARGGGEARISRSPAGYKYEPLSGDPLTLQPILSRLAAEGKVGPDGFVADDVLLAATRDHVYPDVVDRLWRAFHDLFQYRPDVLLSVEEGYHCGSAFQSRTVGKLKAVHGNLRPLSSSGFALTSAGELPPGLRMRDLSTAFSNLGVNVLR